MDLIIGDKFAIEIKSSLKAEAKDAKNLIKIKEEGFIGRTLVISQDPINRKNEDGIEYYYWKTFLDECWNLEFK